MNISYFLKPDMRKEQFTYQGELGFGKQKTDHVFVMDFIGEKWQNPRIVPYDGFSFGSDAGLSIIKPGSKVLHYGYGIFEGAKAHHYNGSLATFRLKANASRFNSSARILDMPTIPEEYFFEGTHTLLDIEKLWMPDGAEDSMYIRPFMVMTDDNLGPNPGNDAMFMVLLSPSGQYLPGSTTLLVQNLFYRAFPGGVGAAKAIGNYAGSARALSLAHLVGAQQSLFTSQEGRIEEAGTCGFGMIQNNVLYLPEQTDTILDSITMRSVERLVNDGQVKGITSAERVTISLDDLLNGISSGTITEVMGLGTAAVVSPIGNLLVLNEKKISPGKIEALKRGKIYANELLEGDPKNYVTNVSINGGEPGVLTKRILEVFRAIQTGKTADYYDWMEVVERRKEMEIMR